MAVRLQLPHPYIRGRFFEIVVRGEAEYLLLMGFEEMGVFTLRQQRLSSYVDS